MLYFLKNLINKISCSINNKKKNNIKNINKNKNLKDIKIVSNHEIYNNIKNKTFPARGELYIIRKFSI